MPSSYPDPPPREGLSTNNPFHYQTRPFVVDLGIVRAGATARRRFNITNLNPVEVNVTNGVGGSGGGALPFASLVLVDIGPLPRAPQALSEIGRHLQVRAWMSGWWVSGVAVGRMLLLLWRVGGVEVWVGGNEERSHCAQRRKAVPLHLKTPRRLQSCDQKLFFHPQLLPPPRPSSMLNVAVPLVSKHGKHQRGVVHACQWGTGGADESAKRW